MTAEAYREFVAPGETAWESYLDEIADVADRARRTHVMVALEDGRIVGSATLELEAGSIRMETARSHRTKRTSACSACTRARAGAVSHGGSWLGARRRPVTRARRS